MRKFCVRDLLTPVLFGVAVVFGGMLISVDANAQMINIGPWEFEQKIDGQIGSIIGCRTNVPGGGTFSDDAMRQPILRARAEVGESTAPFSNCSAHVMAEAELLVMQQPTLVAIECESRGALAVEKSPGMASINAQASIVDVRKTGSFTTVNCSPPSRNTEGRTQVIEFDRKEVCLEPADYLITGRLDVDAEIGLGATFEVAEANMLDRIPSTGFHLHIEAIGSCPSLPMFNSVYDFDYDNNRFLSDTEFFGVVDAWINGQISEMQFFTAIDFWINIAPLPIQSSTAHSFALTATAVPSGMLFSAQSAHDDVTSLNVDIFSSAGEKLLSTQSTGSQLRWGYQSASGERVANGVYFALIEAFDAQGKLVDSEIKRVVVLN